MVHFHLWPQSSQLQILLPHLSHAAGLKEQTRNDTPGWASRCRSSHKPDTHQWHQWTDHSRLTSGVKESVDSCLSPHVSPEMKQWLLKGVFAQLHTLFTHVCVALLLKDDVTWLAKSFLTQLQISVELVTFLTVGGNKRNNRWLWPSSTVKVVSVTLSKNITLTKHLTEPDGRSPSPS